MIGSRLRRLRKELGITQTELAQAISVTKFTVSSYENEHTEPDDATKVLIARRLNVTLDYLLGVVDYPYRLEARADAVSLPPSLTPEQKQLVIDFIRFLELQE